MREIFFTIFILLFVSGCSSKEESHMVKKELPSWYVNPPKDSKTTLYATGDGRERKEAIADALNLLASTLSVSVESQFTLQQSVKEGLVTSHQQSSQSRIDSVVDRVRISNYEIVESQEFGFKKYIVLIKSDKQKLFSSLKNELEQKFSAAQKELEFVKESHALRELEIYKKIKIEFADIQNTLMVMQALKSDFDSHSYLKKAQNITSLYDEQLSKISFSITCDDESKRLQAPIAEGLSLKKVQIEQNSNKREHFNIEVRSKTKESFAYGFIMASSAIEIVVKDVKKIIIGSNKLNITGQSIHSFDAAQESIAIKLDEMIRKEGIGKVLGLEL